jgi:NADPH-dependent ferric siderophore reductase
MLPRPSGLVRIVLSDPTKVGAVNQRLAHDGARVRIVLLTPSCSLPRLARPSRLAVAEGVRAKVLRATTVSIHQARNGYTTILTAFQQGLTGISFQVHGPAPEGVPVTGVLPYKE